MITKYIKVNESIIDYFKLVADFDNESKFYQEATEAEFRYELEKALMCGKKDVKINWIK